MRRNTLQDVLNKLEADPNGGCWLWSGVINPGGYGMVKWAGHPALVHRLIYEHLVEPIPAGLHLCHRCDVRACCNPDHLFPGTAEENMQDRERKGRAVAANELGRPKSLGSRQSRFSPFGRTASSRRMRVA